MFQPGQSDPPANRLTRFSDRVEAYVKHRPSYPAAAIDAILAGLRPHDGGAGLDAADVGAGTGISARLLAERGVRVMAIEPNDAMRAEGQAASGPAIEWRAGTGEATGLAACSLDLMLYAQAFHWVKQEEALQEAARVLRPAGRLAVMWNILESDDAFTRDYARAVRRHAIDPPRSPSFLENPRGPFPHARWRDDRTMGFAHDQTLDREGLIGRAISASYSPKSGAGREALERELARCFAAHARGGVVRLVYRCVVHTADSLA